MIEIELAHGLVVLSTVAAIIFLAGILIGERAEARRWREYGDRESEARRWREPGDREYMDTIESAGKLYLVRLDDD